MANVFAYVETRGADVRKVGLEAVTAARTLADKFGSEVHALLLGPPGIAAKANQIGQYGADVVIVVEHSALANYNPEVATATAAERIKSGGYRAAILPLALPPDSASVSSPTLSRSKSKAIRSSSDIR